jgi:Fur family ferric uptake transcriptional regulator
MSTTRRAVSRSWVDVLRSHEIRVTRSRVRILELLSGEDSAATAQEIHAAMHDRGDKIGLATVYRALAVLSGKGVVDTISRSRGELHYRLCSEAHHHHLLCSQCHRIVELVDCDLDPLLERLAARYDFVVTDHSFEVTGLCGACRAARDEPATEQQASTGRLRPPAGAQDPCS